MEIRYAPGVQPTGDKIFYVMIPGLAGGPYLLNEADHQIFHDGRFEHEHVSTMSPPKNKVRTYRRSDQEPKPDHVSPKVS